MWDAALGLSGHLDIDDGPSERRLGRGVEESPELGGHRTSPAGSGAFWLGAGLYVLAEPVRRTAAVAGPLLVPLDDRGRAPGGRAAEQPVRFGHLPPRLVRRHGLRRDVEVGGDVVGHPPIGGRIWLRHAANDTGGPCSPTSQAISCNPQSKTGYQQSWTVDSASRRQYQLPTARRLRRGVGSSVGARGVGMNGQLLPLRRTRMGLADRRRRQPIDRAVAWWLWNFVSGARLGAGAAISSGRSRTSRAMRGALRVAAVGSVMAADYLWRRGAPYGADAISVAAAAGAGVLCVGLLALVGAWLLAEWWHYMRWIRPLHLALFDAGGWPEGKRPGSWLRVPRDFAHGRDGVVVMLPPTFAGRPSERQFIAQAVREKLGLGDVSDNWVLRGRHSYVQFRPRQRPPDKAPFADPAVRGMVEKAKASAPLIGLTHGNRAVAVDLDSESPHVLLSAGTGGGKSSTIRAVAAQLIHHGALCWVMDAKRHSHSWLRQVPGVRYFRDIGEIHAALIELGKEGRRRNLAFDDIDIDDAAPQFPRLVVICEELNATTSMLKQYWHNNRESGDQPTSPAIMALGQLLFMGRAVRIHVLAVAQLATAKDLGGPEQRENYAVRILARYTANAWKMLVPECTFTPSTRHPGRAQVCIGGTATETQVLFMTPHEARDWALVGRQQTLIDDAAARPLTPAGVAASRAVATTAFLGEAGGTVALPGADVARDTEPADGDGGPVAVSLSEASKDRGEAVVDLRLDALRQASRRDPEFPAPVGRRGQARLYDPEALQRWQRNRPRSNGQDQ